MKINIKCDDKYEAQKLASLIFIKDGKETFITSILNVIKNELVISLKDKSTSILLLIQNVENFEFYTINNWQRRHLVSTKVIDESVDIEKEKDLRTNTV